MRSSPLHRAFLALALVAAVGACRSAAPERAHPSAIRQRVEARRGSDGRLPAASANLRALAQRDELIARSEAAARTRPAGSGGLTSVSWTELGPKNIGGRLRAIATHPTDPNTLWVGTAGGGIWKSTDGGETWSAKGDRLASLSVGTIVVDPRNPNRLFAGTGEGFFEVNGGESATAAIRGAGVLRSDDGGESWALLPSTAIAEMAWVNRLALDPNDGNVLLAATESGIYRSNDGGESWSIRTTGTTFDIDFHPTDSAKAIAGRADGAVLYSTDGGLTFTAASGTSGTRVETAYSASSPSTVYAAVSRSGTYNSSVKVYRSTDGGKKFTLRFSGQDIGTYAFYNLALRVDPVSPDRIVVGGVYLFGSNDGGLTFRELEPGHPDFHAVVSATGYDAVTNTAVYLGNDGGIFRLENVNPGKEIVSLVPGLGITQLYSAAVSPRGVVIGGAQDNGTSIYAGNDTSWADIGILADGATTAADPTDSRFLWGSFQGLAIFRSSDGGNKFFPMTTPNDDGYNFIAPFVLDPHRPGRLLAGGWRLWLSTDSRANTVTWSIVKASRNCKSTGNDQGWPEGPFHTRESDPCSIATIAVSPSSSDVIWVGYNDGQAWLTENGANDVPTWRRVGEGVLPPRWCGRIAVDPFDERRAWVAFLGYESPNVFRTDDAGATWTPADGSGEAALPAVPVGALAAHPLKQDWIYAGTDVGLFASEDGGETWSTSAAGPANVSIEEITWANSSTLLVATYGRGAWAGDTGVRDCDENGIADDEPFGDAGPLAGPCVVSIDRD